MNPMSVSMLIPAFQQAAADVAEVVEPGVQAAEEGGVNGWIVLLVLVLVLVGPFLIGQLIANALKLKDLGFRMGVVLFAITLGLSPFINEIRQGNPISNAISLGIDLEGGTNMVFAVDVEQVRLLDKTLDAETMDRMVAAIGRRINPSGTEEVTVRLIPPDRIEVIVPGADPEKVERIKGQIVKLGSLEFALLANTQEHRELIYTGN